MPVGLSRFKKDTGVMPSLDTNCLLRWFLNDIPEQAARVAALVTSGRFLRVDDVVIFEAVYAMERGAKISRSTIRQYFTVAMTYPLAIDRDLWTAVFDIWVSHPKLSIIDVYLSVKAQGTNDDPVYTFDVKMANQMDTARMVPDLPSSK